MRSVWWGEQFARGEEVLVCNLFYNEEELNPQMLPNRPGKRQC